MGLFAYFMDRDEFVVEYTAKMEHVDDRTYTFHGPEFWDQRTTMDAWGLADPPTERFRSRHARRPAVRTTA